MNAFLRGRRSAIASTTVLSLAAGSLVAMAVASDVRSSTSVSLHDAGVWVTGTSGGILGLFNAEIRQSVIALVPNSERFDVLQDGSTVLLNDLAGARLRSVDGAGAAIVGAGAELPRDAAVAMGGGVLTVSAPTGDVWIRTAGEAGRADFSVPPDLRLGAGAAVAVGQDGTVYAASPAQSRLISLPRGAAARSITTVSAIPAGTTSVAITVVGDAPVVLVDGARILIPGRPAVALPGAATAGRLQQVSAAAAEVLVASDSGLYSVALSSSTVTTIGTTIGSAKPAAPVRLGRCSYAAWGAKPTLLAGCDGGKVTVTPVGDGSAGTLEFRVNRGRIVLNDIGNGNTFLLDDPRQQLADWKSARQRDDEADQDPNKTDSSDDSDIRPEDRSKPNRPPKAVADTFGVRAGAIVVMPLLANDSDPDGDVLTVAGIIGDVSAEIGNVQIIENGKAIQFVTAPDATGTVSFTYSISDGRDGTSDAVVTVPVVDADANTRPRPLAASATSTSAVVRGGRVVHNILKDWVDPDGDPLSLVCPAVSPGVQCSPDGQVVYQDTRRQTSTKQLVLEVSDGRESARSALSISIIAPGSQPPLARSDFVHAFVGRTVLTHPLDNDTSFGREAVRLAKVEGVPPALGVVVDTDQGTLGITPTAAGTYYLTYQISTGAQAAVGIIRVDATESGAGSGPVAAPDSALVRAGQPALVDVLANDVDPAGNVLVVTDVRASAPGLTIEVLGHRLVRLSAEADFLGPASIAYEVHAGSKSASSVIFVRRHAEGTSNQPPVAKDDRIVARIGQPVYISVLANDVDPEAAQLEIEPALIGADAAFRPLGLASAEQSRPIEAFVTRDQVRLLAPAAPGTVTLSYSAVDPEGQRASATITVNVLSYDAPNRPPAPRPIEVRVLAERSVTLDIALSGIDPDGDPVRLEPVDSPAKGTLALTKENRLVYTAGPETGTYEFRYQVTDSGGLSGLASVLVGVAPRSSSPRPPVAVNDTVRIRNDRDRVVSIPVLVNDSDPDGDALTLQPALVAPDGVRARVAGEYVAVSVPRGSTEQMTMGYQIASTGGTDDALVSIRASATAPLVPPTAVDDFPAATGSGRTMDVEVLANDTNATGPVSELAVSPRPGAVGPAGVARRVNARTVRVTRIDRDQWATYTINDGDGGESKAFIFVPRNDNQPPRPVDPLPVFQIKAGTSRQLSVADFAVDPEGGRLELTNASSISASGVSVSGVTRTGFIVTPTVPAGKASVTFEVMDGADGNDPNVRTSQIAIVVDVLPIDEVQPVFRTQRLLVEAGEARPARLDLDAHTSAGPADAGRFSYTSLTGSVAGLDAAQSGARGNILTVSAREAPVGTRITLSFTITLGKQSTPGRVEVEVVQTRRPLPRATDCAAGSAPAGSTVTVELQRCTVNPFPDSPLTVVPANWRGEAAVAVARGTTVTIALATAFTGSSRLPYTVKDKLGRTASAYILLTVLGKPGPPGQPEIGSPLPGGGAVWLTWSAAAANGGTIDYYTVRALANGYAHRCVGASTRCLITGIDYSKPYTFTVAAHSVEAGEGQPSAPVTLSPAAVSPEIPRNLDAAAGDGRATLSWTGPARGAPAASYTVVIRPAPSEGAGVFSVPAAVADSAQRASMTVTGLRNGTDYTFTVATVARGGETSAEVTGSVFSPNGPAGTPSAPSAVSSGGLRGGQVTVGWDPGNIAQAANGRLASLRIVQGGTQAATIDATAAVTLGRLVVDGLDASGTYTFALQVTNTGGSSATSPAASVTVEGKPGPPTWVSAVAGDGQATLSFQLAAPNGTEYKNITLLAVNRSDGTDREVAVPVVAGQTSYTVVAGSLTNGDTYGFTVTACNVSQCSEPAAAPNAVVPSGLPTAPQPAVSVDGRTVSFSWDNAQFNGAGGQLLIDVTGAGYPAQACPQQTAGAGRCSFLGQYNTTYTMTIKATTSGGDDTKSVSGTVEPAARPVAPKASASSAFQTVTFSWGAPDLRSLPGSMTIAVEGEGYPGSCAPATTSEGSCSFPGAWGTTYTLLLTVRTEGGTDTSTAMTQTVPAPVPTAPAVTGTAARRVVTFSWAAPNFKGLTGVMRLAVSGSGDAGACPATDTGAGTCSFEGDWNTAYEMTVTVETAGGVDSSAATALVGAPPQPGAPQPGGSTDGRSVTFTWGDPIFNGLDGTMTLVVSGNGYSTGCPSSATAAGACTFTGLYNTEYTMAVTVSTAGGSDTKSTSVPTAEPPVPSAPTVTGEVVDGRNVRFEWGPPDFKGLPGTMTLSVTPANAPGAPGNCPSTAEGAGSCTVNGAYATEYTLTVTVTTEGGSVSASDNVRTDPEPLKPPVAPEVIGEVTDGREVTFRWGAPNFNGPTGRMRLSLNEGGTPGTCPPDTQTSGGCTFTGEFSTTYRLTITVETAGGRDSAFASVTTDGPPPPPPPSPTAPTVTGEAAGRAVSFSWAQPDYKSLPGTTTVAVDGPGAPTDCAPAADGSGRCEFTGAWDAAYTLTVTVATAGGTDRSTGSVRTEVKPPTAPTISAQVTGRTVTFSWGDPDFQGITGSLELTVTPAAENTCPATATAAGSCTITGDFVTEYTMSITATTSTGSDSSSLTVMTDSPPPQTEPPTEPPPAPPAP